MEGFFTWYWPGLLVGSIDPLTGWPATNLVTDRISRRDSFGISVEECELISLIYQVLIDDMRCSRCRAELNRRIHLETRSGRAETRQIVIVVRCRGWGRHRHTATVTERAAGLVFGQLHPS